MAKNNILINCGKLREDVDNVNRSLKLKDGLTLSKRLDKAHIGSATFANSLTAFDRNKDIDVTLYEDCDKKGLMSELRLFAICNLFGLNGDEYILKLKKNTGNKLKSNEPEEKIREYMGDKNIVDRIIESAEIIQNNTGNNDMHAMQILALLTEKADRLDQWYKLFSEQLGQIDSNTYQIKKLNEAVEKIGRIEAQNVEYLKEIKDGIEKLNEKWN